ncbi:universal stress protein [Pseudonocardia asaccharolytica]|nr:universal stress protein [Pseudonocardia asaccharolytica]
MADEHQDPGVIVGVDGTDTALRAVRWAVTEARSRRLPLTVVHAAPYATDPAGRRRAASILARGYTVALRQAPDVKMRTERLDGQPLRALLDAADRAALMVVGMVGGDHVHDALIGSLALDLAGRASCPVVVVRGDPPPAGGPVLVGVLDAATDAAALTAAFADARIHRTRLIALHSGTMAADRLADELAPWRDRFPTVEVDLRVTDERPIEALLEEAAQARLVVVGANTRSAPMRVLLGSTSRALVRWSPCPVAVVSPQVTSIEPELELPAPARVTEPRDRGELW